MKTLFGWAGKILRVDVTDGGTSEMPTMNYAPRFIGGQGIASRAQIAFYFTLMVVNAMFCKVEVSDYIKKAEVLS